MGKVFNWFEQLYTQAADSCEVPHWSLTTQWWCTSMVTIVLGVFSLLLGLYLVVKLCRAVYLALSVPWLATKCRRLRRERARLEHEVGNARKLKALVDTHDLGKE